MDKFSRSRQAGEVTNLTWVGSKMITFFVGSKIIMGSSTRNIEGNESINRTHPLDEKCTSLHEAWVIFMNWSEGGNKRH